MKALFILFTSLSAIIAAIAFFGSVIILSVKKANIVEAEVKAKDGSTKIKKKDVLYNKCIKISVIAAVISLIAISFAFIVEASMRANNSYDHYHGRAEYSRSQIESFSDVDMERSLGDWREYYIHNQFDYYGYKVMALLIVILNLFFWLYMYPTKTARIKNHDQTTAIAWLNAIFGITVIGWVAMLIWANSPGNYNDDQNKKMNLNQLENQLEKLKSLLDSGVITQEEFEEKRKDLIKNI